MESVLDRATARRVPAAPALLRFAPTRRWSRWFTVAGRAGAALLAGGTLLAGLSVPLPAQAHPAAQQGRCISGEKSVSVNGMAGPFVRNSVTSANPDANAANPLVAHVPGTFDTPADSVNIPTAIFDGPNVFYKFEVKNCGSVNLHNVRLDDCIDQRSVGDPGFLAGGANGRCVEDPRLIPANPRRIIADVLKPGETKTVYSSTFTMDPISKVDICKAFGRQRTNGIIRNDSEVEAEADVDGNGQGEAFTYMDDLNLVRCKDPGVKIVKFTNGHDGDDPNGTPTPEMGAFTVGTGTVAQVPAGSAITWTYRVTNIGSEPLAAVSVTDNRLGMVTCPKNTLAVNEVMNCTASGFAGTLTAGGSNVQGCGSGGELKRPTYTNRGTVTARGAITNAELRDENDSHYCNPPAQSSSCLLGLSKTCEVVQPPNPVWADCSGKLQQFSLIWPSNGGTINISGIANDAPGGVVNPGQRVTFSGPFSSNDQVLNISGAATGQSTFHVSCSDRDMDGLSSSNDAQQQLPGKAQDCGKFAGNGKANSSSLINRWLLDGLADADGKVLNCSPAPTQTTNACSFQAQDAPACGTGGSGFKPNTLTFQYTGGNCATQSNGQSAGKTSCSGQINPNLPVNVVYPGGSANGVAPGTSFTMPRSGSNSVITLSNAGGTQTMEIHTSCSQPLAVGDVYYGLTLVAMDGQGLGKDVRYSFRVTNNGATPLTNIMVTDNKLGPIPGSPIASLGGGQSQTLTATTMVSESTTNVATATAASCPAPGVTSTATVTVMPQPPCTVEQTFAKIEDDKYSVTLSNPGSKTATLDRLVLNWAANATYGSIKEVKFGSTLYKADRSNLVVRSGVPITDSGWTEPDVSKRQLAPGKSETLEITFQQKWAKANCPNGNCFAGTARFAQGCMVNLGQAQ